MPSRFDAMLAKFVDAESDVRRELMVKNEAGEMVVSGIFIEVNLKERSVTVFDKNDRFTFPYEAVGPAADVFKYLMGNTI